MNRRVTPDSKVKPLRGGAEGKPSLNRALPCHTTGLELSEVDPKPGELTMSRVKVREIGLEARTGECRKIL